MRRVAYFSSFCINLVLIIDYKKLFAEFHFLQPFTKKMRFHDKTITLYSLESVIYNNRYNFKYITFV